MRCFYSDIYPSIQNKTFSFTFLPSNQHISLILLFFLRSVRSPFQKLAVLFYKYMSVYKYIFFFSKVDMDIPKEIFINQIPQLDGKISPFPYHLFPKGVFIIQIPRLGKISLLFTRVIFFQK